MEIICLMNYYWQQDKKQSWQMHLTTMLDDIKLSKAQIARIIQSGGF